MKILSGNKLKKIAKAISSKILGFVIWQGTSVLDGSPIAAIATLNTSNKKTGEMVQIWIIRTDINPVEASKIGLDSAICGSCVHRHFNGGGCYVNIGQAPNAVYKAYKAGKYPAYNEEIHGPYLTNRKIRLGAYGDPAAVPFEVMEYLANIGTAHTGYTHQMKHKNFDPRFIDICMVSADSPKQAKKWHEKGARTFRVAMDGDGMYDNESECLSETVGAQCIECGLCDGSKRNADSIVITVHGSLQKRFKTARLIDIKEVA